MMDIRLLLLILLVGLPILVVLGLRNRRQLKANQKVYESEWGRLLGAIRENSLLVSAQAPTDEEAHSCIITASQCLVVPDLGRNVIGYDFMFRRLQIGFQAVNRAREICGQPPIDENPPAAGDSKTTK